MTLSRFSVKNGIISFIKPLLRINCFYIFCNITFCLFLIISIYNHPVSDDFYLFYYTSDMSFWDFQKKMYLTCNGRYTYFFLFSLIGLFENLFNVVKLSPVLLIILFCIAIYLFQNLICRESTFTQQLQASISFTTLFLLGLIQVSTSFYWFSSALSYMVGSILLILFCYLLFSVLFLNKNNLFNRVLVYLSLVLTIGCNETFLITVMGLLFSIVIYKLLIEKKLCLFALCLLLVGIFCSVLTIFAPGNVIRFYTEPIGIYPTDGSLKLNVIHTLVESFATIYKMLLSYNSIILLIFACNMLTILKINFLNSISITKKFYITSISFILLTLPAFPSFFATNYIQPRVLNVVWLLLLLLFAVNISLYYDLLIKIKVIKFLLSCKLCIFAIRLAFVLILIYSLNFRTIYCDLFKGRAMEYDRQLNARYELLKSSNDNICYLPKLTVYAYSIFYADIEEDSKCNANQSLARYFHSNEILPASHKNN